VVDNSVDAFSDQQVAMLRKDIRSMKKQLIATNQIRQPWFGYGNMKRRRQPERQPEIPWATA
jgi:hypothetical protein